MKAPLIGITASKNRKGDDRLPAAYSAAVQAAGGMPLLIPTSFPLNAAGSLVDKLDGLLLSGGGDIEPGLYHASDPEKCGDILPERDHLELALLKQAAGMNLPVLGICRGLQVINVYRGGTLITDIPSQISSRLTHSSPEELGRDYLAHEVTIKPDTLLKEILGESPVKTNSFHHQAALKIGTDLTITAHAADGIVEGLEDRSQKFFVAVQWHPECLQMYPVQQKLFQAFIRACTV